MTERLESKLHISESSGDVSTILLRPDDAMWLLVFGHGAGANMRHNWMESMSQELANVGIATLRYNFPYMETGRGAPNNKPILYETVRAAVDSGSKLGLPMLAGGKSMGGRMTSNAAALEPLGAVKGIVFFGFPLHPSGKPSIERADHLASVQVPMLFLQGTRDTLAELPLLVPVCERLGDKALLHIVDTADHSFHVQKSSGFTDTTVLTDLAATVREWASKLA